MKSGSAWTMAAPAPSTSKMLPAGARATGSRWSTARCIRSADRPPRACRAHVIKTTNARGLAPPGVFSLWQGAPTHGLTAELIGKLFKAYPPVNSGESHEQTVLDRRDRVGLVRRRLRFDERRGGRGPTAPRCDVPAGGRPADLPGGPGRPVRFHGLGGKTAERAKKLSLMYANERNKKQLSTTLDSRRTCRH